MPISFDWSETISALPSNPIPADWIATKGKGVKVAFIDTGVNLGLPSFTHLGISGRKFFTGAPGFSVTKLVGQDLVGEAFGGTGPGHGTRYASLLAGKSPDSSTDEKELVNGIAPDADWYIIKARNPNDKKTTIRNLLDALELSANLGIEIAITGQCISASEMPFEGLNNAALDRVFSLPGVKKMFVFAPLKNLEPTDTWGLITSENIPSRRPEIFNVAKLPDNFGAVADVIKNQPIPFLLSSFQGKVLSKTGDAIDLTFSNSGAVAIMGGIAVLALSFFKNQNAGTLPNREGMLQLLGNTCQSLDNASLSVTQPAIFKNF
ncbi:MAG: S8 family serine peptidase [Saprospiraceae bacterium]